MFKKSALLHDVAYGDKDYAAEAAAVCAEVRAGHPQARDLLDVACGTGRHLEQLSARYRVEGGDLNPLLLERARARCPGVPLHQLDMTEFSLDRSYDVVTCLFSSIGYAGTVERMRRAVSCMAGHLRSPGTLVIEPWFTPESYWEGHLAANFHDLPELKLAWMYRQERRDARSILDVHCLVIAPGGAEHFVERHDLGLFTRAEMEGAFAAAGLTVSYHEGEVFKRGLYVGRRPARS
ncbi:MAG: class I SAM-dependent methyltransferase [Actinomycetota bacterium]|nr:class I SAM-dependent methyltransferase [Actinomycetota bacterium]